MCSRTMQYKGQQGVELALKILLEEFRVTMALAGYVWVCLCVCVMSWFFDR